MATPGWKAKNSGCRRVKEPMDGGWNREYGHGISHRCLLWLPFRDSHLTYFHFDVHFSPQLHESSWVKWIVPASHPPVTHLGPISSTQDKLPQVIQFQPFQPIQLFTTFPVCMQNYAMCCKRTWKFRNDAWSHRSYSLFWQEVAQIKKCMNIMERNLALRINSLRNFHTFDPAISFQDNSQHTTGRPDKNYMHTCCFQ